MKERPIDIPHLSSLLPIGCLSEDSTDTEKNQPDPQQRERQVSIRVTAASFGYRQVFVGRIAPVFAFVDVSIGVGVGIGIVVVIGARYTGVVLAILAAGTRTILDTGCAIFAFVAVASTIATGCGRIDAPAVLADLSGVAFAVVGTSTAVFAEIAFAGVVTTCVIGDTPTVLANFARIAFTVVGTSATVFAEIAFTGIVTTCGPPTNPGLTAFSRFTTTITRTIVAVFASGRFTGAVAVANTGIFGGTNTGRA